MRWSRRSGITLAADPVCDELDELAMVITGDRDALLTQLHKTLDRRAGSGLRRAQQRTPDARQHLGLAIGGGEGAGRVVEFGARAGCRSTARKR